MSALEIIAQIKELPTLEQVKVARFMAENGGLLTSSPISIGMKEDGLPVIQVPGGAITSQLVHELACRTP